MISDIPVPTTTPRLGVTSGYFSWYSSSSSGCLSKLFVGEATMRFFFSGSAAGPSSRPGAKTGLLPMSGTSRPCVAATPAAEAVWPGATVSAMALTPAAFICVIWALMSWSVALILASTSLSPWVSAMYFEPSRPPAPYSPSK